MTPIDDYIGKDVYSSDDKKLGRVTSVWDGERYEASHVLVIDHLVASDIFVPLSVVQESGERLTVPYPAEFVRSAPPLSQDRGASGDDLRLLEAYYRAA